MRSILRSTLIAAVMFAAPAVAQQAEEDLSLGEPVGPQLGEPYVAETFGDWALRCIKAEEGQDEQCSLYQLLMNAEGRAVAEFNIFKLPEGNRAAAGANVVVPLETLLTQQLTITVDGSNARRYPFTFCNRAGCVARVGFTAEEIEQFKRGSVATVRVVPAAAPDEEFVLEASLSGFTAAFDAASVVVE